MNAKDLGELSELRFILEAAEKGFKVSKPLTTEKYDLIIDHDGTLYRVQVKSTHVERFQSPTYKKGYYKIMLSYGANAKKSYTEEMVDLVAAYIAPLKLWYIIPMSKILNKSTLVLRPESSGAKFNKYINNWDF